MHSENSKISLEPINGWLHYELNDELWLFLTTSSNTEGFRYLSLSIGTRLIEYNECHLGFEFDSNNKILSLFTSNISNTNYAIWNLLIDNLINKFNLKEST